MALNNIPGRRLTNGDSFYTDWAQRGGDSMILRAEVLENVGTSNLKISVQTRKEPGGGLSTVSVTEPSGSDFTLTGTGVDTAYFDANMEAEVRLKVECTTGTYVVARIFPPVFFDNAK